MCNEQTYGVFNPAKDIIKKMKEQEKHESETNAIENEVTEKSSDDED